jgi:hypothetical protein
MKKIFIILIIIIFLISPLVQAQQDQIESESQIEILTRNQPGISPFDLPQIERFEDIESSLKKIFQFVPSIVKIGFQETFSFLKKIWENYIWRLSQSIWKKIKKPFLKEFERRRSSALQEVKKIEKEKKSFKKPFEINLRNFWKELPFTGGEGR